MLRLYGVFSSEEIALTISLCMARPHCRCTHRCKRETIGLPSNPASQWLLEIDFGKRELFFTPAKLTATSSLRLVAR